MAALLEVNNASFAYEDQRVIFDKVQFTIKQGDLLTILGPNGSGKSTLLNCIAGLCRLKRGKIFLDGQDLNHMAHKQIAQKIAYLPQTYQVAYGFSVREFIVMGRAPHLGVFSKPSRQDYQLADETMAQMNLIHFANKAVTRISGGERQLVCIARAIVQKPELILFDEPTSALDYGNQLRVLRLIKQLSAEGYSIIMTTHNPDHPILLGGAAGVLSRAGHMETGPVDEILKQERLSELYGINMQIVYVNEISRYACVPESL